MRYQMRLSLLCSAALLSAGQAHAANTSGADPAGEVQKHAQRPSSDEIIVFGRASSGTSLSIPKTVNVLDASVIEQTGSETVGDALRLVPGAQRDGSPLDTFGDTFLVREFEANRTLNGMYANALRQARDSIGIERIEVLKGPASVLYGQLQPGAVVNVVTKQPKREFSGAVSLSYGRFDDVRGTRSITTKPMTIASNF